MPAAKLPQTLEYVSQVVIFDVGCGGIQSVRCAGSGAIDRIGTPASAGPHRGGSRMERTSGLLARIVKFPAGRPAKPLDCLFGLFAKLRGRFR